MRCPEVVRHENRLDYLFSQIRTLPPESELMSHWARYLCVLVSGFIEVSIRSIYGEYVKKKAAPYAPYVANYAESRLRGLKNPNMEKILNLTRAFSVTWADELETIVDDEQKDAVDSIVAIRNRIAHGENVGITYSSIRKYYESATKLIEMIENQCKL